MIDSFNKTKHLISEYNKNKRVIDTIAPKQSKHQTSKQTPYHEDFEIQMGKRINMKRDQSPPAPECLPPKKAGVMSITL